MNKTDRALILVGFIIIVLILIQGLGIGPQPGDPSVSGNPWAPFMDISYVFLSQSYIWGTMLIAVIILFGFGLSIIHRYR